MQESRDEAVRRGAASELVVRAARLADSMLAAEPERYRHSACVAARAEFLAVAVDAADVPVLLASFVAAARGLADELTDFPFMDDPVADALTVADQTIGPDGAPMTIDDRMRDMLARHGPASSNARAHLDREPYLRAAADRVAVRLSAAGVPPDQHHII